MIECAILEGVSTTNLVQQCDIIGSGALRLLTPFQYPDGSQIDLFIEEPEPLLKTKILSDLGQTTAYLLDLQVKPWATNKRRQVIEDICRTLEVKWRQGRFLIELSAHDMTDLSPLMLRLAQACIRISDLALSARIWAAGSFRDELEEYLDSLDVQVEPNPVEINREGKPVKLDFRISGASAVSLVQSLSAGSSSSAHHVANDALARWFDLGKPKKNGPQHVTVVDESNDLFKEDDLDRVGRLSSVFRFPADQDELTSTLTA